MAISRVVSKKYLQQWLKDKHTRTYGEEPTVREILDIVRKESEEVNYETRTADVVFVRLDHVVKDKKGEKEWVRNGGALTVPDPEIAINLARYNAVKLVPHAARNESIYHPPTVTFEHQSNMSTLTINLSSEV